jgi:hypothetical protein
MHLQRSYRIKNHYLYTLIIYLSCIYPVSILYLSCIYPVSFLYAFYTDEISIYLPQILNNNSFRVLYNKIVRNYNSTNL